VSFDDQIRNALEHALAEARDRVDDTFKAFAQNVRRLAEAEIETARRAAEAEAEDRVTSQLAAAADNDRRTREAVERANADADAAALAHAARLADAIRTLDGARTLVESLDCLAQSAGQEVDRAAVLLLKGQRLHGWRFVGFAPSIPSAKSIEFQLEAAGIAGDAARNSHVVTNRGASEQLPPFARDAGSRHAFAAPVIVGGAVVAVLYADASADTAASSTWTAVLEVLSRHVSRALESIIVRQATGLSLPRPMARASHPDAVGPESGRLQ
jgi:hypothetical protein